MKYRIQFTSAMKKGVKRMEKRGKDMSELSLVLSILSSGEKLPVKYYDHALSGKLTGLRECHIQPDWLLIYEIRNNELILIAVDTGTHSELYKK